MTTPPDDVVVVMGRRERSVLLSIVRSIEGPGSIGSDAAARRLFPPASDIPDVAEEFAEMTGDDLRSLHGSDEETLLASLEQQTSDEWRMSPEEAEACVRAVGAARIAMAARLGLFDDTAPRVGFTKRAAVNFLGYVQDRMVNAVLAELPDSPDAT